MTYNVSSGTLNPTILYHDCNTPPVFFQSSLCRSLKKDIPGYVDFRDVQIQHKLMWKVTRSSQYSEMIISELVQQSRIET